MAISRTKGSNGSVTIPRSEFIQLKKQALAYQSLTSQLFELPLRNTATEVRRDFEGTDLYTNCFLDDLESGLRKSSYSRKYGHRTIKKGS
ncbi:MAG: hypothetical protein A2986_00815 [Candidatus Jacksonbacteria bacterium RIFCSPLOWO2_01_FULL_44_13]|uniref:Uncharacterized protein n=1 Tax=candidate division CPR1 bacterium GW2011_GWA2_42_17 TaxID=1618341 RepID=A0A0G0Z6M1_9BACT|nr:MAG: hypothetical protein UV05_C0007G0025 [candidate division CPR1 bacterium GW2011_GWA2_42_17]OGY71004.1 MAG: hypothetical protein A2986_00815 [Candidatus Jacksonbacteria bacterium RIFCSPLOWO2_01_FULL_44_13]